MILPILTWKSYPYLLTEIFEFSEMDGMIIFHSLHSSADAPTWHLLNLRGENPGSFWRPPKVSLCWAVKTMWTYASCSSCESAWTQIGWSMSGKGLGYWCALLSPILPCLSLRLPICPHYPISPLPVFSNHLHSPTGTSGLRQSVDVWTKPLATCSSGSQYTPNSLLPLQLLSGHS